MSLCKVVLILSITMFMQIFQLEKRLQDQLGERRALEAALGFRSSISGDRSAIAMSKVTINIFMKFYIDSPLTSFLLRFSYSRYAFHLALEVPYVKLVSESTNSTLF